jgi:hypothetical protein
MMPDGPREDEPPEETVGARDMSQKETQAKPGTSSTTSASNQRLSRPVGALGETSDLDTTSPPKPGDNDRATSGTIPLRAPDIPPSSAPAGLGVGFGPKEPGPPPVREAYPTIHPEDLVGGYRVPHPVAIRGSASLGIVS